jgi:hypothetical protein
MIRAAAERRVGRMEDIRSADVAMRRCSMPNQPVFRAII